MKQGNQQPESREQNAAGAALKWRACVMAVALTLAAGLTNCTPESALPYLGSDDNPQCSSTGSVAYMHRPGPGGTRARGLYVVGLDSLRVRLLASDDYGYDWLPGTDSLLVRHDMLPPRIISSVSGGGRTLSVNVWPGSIAPNGQWIANTSLDFSGNEEREAVSLVNLNTGETRDITPDSMRYSEPSWSPSGDRLVVLGGSHSDSGIFIIDAAGAPIRRIVPSSGDTRSPVWSPRGDLIAWIDGAGSGELYVVDTLGTNKRLVTTAQVACWDNRAPTTPGMAFVGGLQA